MARAVYNDNGGFAGVALAVINPSFFQELIYALDIGKKGYVVHLLLRKVKMTPLHTSLATVQHQDGRYWS